MTLNQAKARGQARALEINNRVLICRIAPRRFEIRDDNGDFDNSLTLVINPTWITNGYYRGIGWPAPTPSATKAAPAATEAIP